jgi:hypothetical protein
MDPFGQIAATMERIATDDTTAASREERLREVRGQLSDLLGQADSYLGRAEKAGQSEASNRARAVLQARARADIRESLIQTGQSEDVLDAEGLLSHGELDRLGEEGLLEEYAVELQKHLAGGGARGQAAR